MLNDSPVSAILPAKDLIRAKEFYQNKLGLKLLPMAFDDPLIFEAGSGTTLVVYHREQGTKAEHTVAGFNVKDLTYTLKSLEANGVVFEDYDLPNMKTINHIVEFDNSKSAFFKDTEGNIIALNEM